MERLERVLDQRRADLIEVLESGAGLPAAAADRFVALAGAELMASYRWQSADLDDRDLLDPSNARDLLSAVRASRIAADLGVSLAQVWIALRAFVPYVLQLTEGVRQAQPKPYPWRPERAPYPSRRTPRPGLLHPMD